MSHRIQSVLKRISRWEVLFSHQREEYLCRNKRQYRRSACLYCAASVRKPRPCCNAWALKRSRIYSLTIRCALSHIRNSRKSARSARTMQARRWPSVRSRSGNWCDAADAVCSSVQAHLVTVRESSPQPGFICPICAKRFDRASAPYSSEKFNRTEIACIYSNRNSSQESNTKNCCIAPFPSTHCQKESARKPLGL